MNYDISKDALSTRNLVFEGCKEVPVDLDFSLPDYCPDIQKILKCRLLPHISSRNVSGDRLNIEGNAKIKVLYIDSENNKIKCCENSVAFSCSLDIKSNPESAFAITNIKVDYVNCRAVSPRKLDIHGSFSICAKVYNKKNVDISSSINGKDIQQKISDMRVNNLIGIGQQQFSIGEVIELNEENPAPEMIINTEVNAVLNDYKNMQNKTVVKGEATLKIFYINNIDSGETSFIEYKIPISQIVDVPGIDENSKCIIMGEIFNHEEQLNLENNANAGFISCEIKMVATVFAYNEKDISLVSDVYSTQYNTEISKTPITICQLSDDFIEDISFKESIKLSDINASDVLNVWVDNSSIICDSQEEKLLFKIKSPVCMLLENGEEAPVYIERILEFDHFKSYENPLSEVICECKIVPSKITFSLQNCNTVEIKIDFKILCQVYSCKKLDMVTNISADETNPILKDNASLTVYYAHKGENIWDIAKKYYTSCQMIKEENDLQDSKLRNDGMLLIPMK